MGGDRAQRGHLVLPKQATVALDIGTQDRDELAGHTRCGTHQRRLSGMSPAVVKMCQFGVFLALESPKE